jgi:hypothetical protein
VEPGKNFFVPLNLIIDTSDGDDAVAVTADVRLSTVINTGNGNDFVAVGRADISEIDDPDIGGDLAITTGKGNDNVCALRFTAFGAVAVVTGDGNDEAHLESFDAAAAVVNTGNGNDGSPTGDSPITVFDAEIFVDLNGDHEQNGNEPFGSLTVVTGNGDDLVDVDAVFAATIVVDTGAGNDGDPAGFPIEIDNCTVRGNVILNTGPGNDDAEVLNEPEELDEGDGFIGGSLIVNMGAGSDRLRLGEEADRNIVVDGSVVVVLGAGADDLFVLNASIGLNATIDAGSGNDFVNVFGSTIGLITTIAMGTGNDTLDIFESGGGSDLSRLIADGGPGKDTFNNDLGVDSNGNFDDNHIIVRNFEFFNEADMVATLASGGKKKGW